MLRKIILPLTAILLMLLSVACGPSGMVENQESTAVIGVVIDSDTHERISGATITLGEELSAVSNENGAFTFINVPVGSHTVSVDAGNNGSTETTLNVVDGGTRTEIRL